MTNQPVEDAEKLIPEFFYDIIGRVLPGIMVVIVYAWDALPSQVSFVPGAGILMAGYFLGLCADVFCSAVLRLLLWFISLIPLVHQWPRIFSIQEQSAQIDSLSESPRNLVKKLIAESTFFRTNAIFCVLLLAYPAPAFKGIDHYYIIVGVALFLFSSLHLERQLTLKHRVSDLVLATRT
jgi:hypothetical protein